MLNSVKKFCITKKRLQGNEKIKVNENVLAFIQRKLLEKCKDPRTFNIPCTIGNTIFTIMLDLGASINIMPYSIFSFLILEALKNINIIIQLANTSFAQPKGVIEDVLVQVKNLFFPTDFYNLDMTHDSSTNSTSIILGRPFMKTTMTKTNVDVDSLTMEFDGDVVHFDILDTKNSFTFDHSLIVVKAFDFVVLEDFELQDDDYEFYVALESFLRENSTLP